MMQDNILMNETSYPKARHFTLEPVSPTKSTGAGKGKKSLAAKKATTTQKARMTNKSLDDTMHSIMSDFEQRRNTTNVS